MKCDEKSSCKYIPSAGRVNFFNTQCGEASHLTLQVYPGSQGTFGEDQYISGFSHCQNLTLVTLKVYNAIGQVVKTLVNESQKPSQYEVAWDGKNDEGVSVGSGIYFYSIEVNGFEQTNKMILLK